MDEWISTLPSFSSCSHLSESQYIFSNPGVCVVGGGSVDHYAVAVPYAPEPGSSSILAAVVGVDAAVSPLGRVVITVSFVINTFCAAAFILHFVFWSYFWFVCLKYFFDHPAARNSVGFFQMISPSNTHYLALLSGQSRG